MLKPLIGAFLLGSLLGLPGASAKSLDFPRYHVLQPIDEAHLSADFTAFRQHLWRVVEQKDVPAFAKLLRTDIKCTFGLNTGKVGCLAMWGLNKNPQQATIWRDLRDVLRLGGQFERVEGATHQRNFSVFVAPYTFASDFTLKSEVYFGFITGTQVQARQHPQRQAPIVETLTYNVVEIEDEGPAQGLDYPWYQIITPHGKRAYVYGQFIRSSFAHRAIFSKSPTGWQIDVLIAGD